MSENDPAPVEIPPRGTFFSTKQYDFLKWIAQILIPAGATLYGTIALATGIPQTDVVLTIVGAVDLFLGTILGISTRNYNDAVRELDAKPKPKLTKFDGEINIDTVNVDKDVFSIEPYDGLLGLADSDKETITLKVNRVAGNFVRPDEEDTPLPGNDG